MNFFSGTCFENILIFVSSCRSFLSLRFRAYFEDFDAHQRFFIVFVYLFAFYVLNCVLYCIFLSKFQLF